ncbi:hypothetical protein SAMN04489740_4043 [Arthrobacter alpinus]|uniref:Uncharacterized protein n=1 Tax=Arthrobacter alpinus TaxID=656366 RepID=A0A1H5PAE9_9MICC|nr:hypothetical protein SAMN04489740_4043 [Arthrobacter alpinus]
MILIDKDRIGNPHWVWNAKSFYEKSVQSNFPSASSEVRAPAEGESTKPDSTGTISPPSGPPHDGTQPPPNIGREAI